MTYYFCYLLIQKNQINVYEWKIYFTTGNFYGEILRN